MNPINPFTKEYYKQQQTPLDPGPCLVAATFVLQLRELTTQFLMFWRRLAREPQGRADAHRARAQRRQLACGTAAKVSEDRATHSPTHLLCRLLVACAELLIRCSSTLPKVCFAQFVLQAPHLLAISSRRGVGGQSARDRRSRARAALAVAVVVANSRGAPLEHARAQTLARPRSRSPRGFDAEQARCDQIRVDRRGCCHSGCSHLNRGQWQRRSENEWQPQQQRRQQWRRSHAAADEIRVGPAAPSVGAQATRLGAGVGGSTGDSVCGCAHPN